MTFIVVRARSDVKVERSIRETMGYMNLTRVNHAVIIPDNPQYRGMLQKAKDYITWGQADAAMVERMLSERGRMVGEAQQMRGLLHDKLRHVRRLGDEAGAESDRLLRLGRPHDLR